MVCRRRCTPTTTTQERWRAFRPKLRHCSNMVILNVFAKTSTIIVGVYGIFVTLVRVESFSSWTKDNDGRYVKKGGCQHPTRELKGISCAFPEVQGSNQHLLAIDGTSSRQLNQFKNSTSLPGFTHLRLDFFSHRMQSSCFLVGGAEGNTHKLAVMYSKFKGSLMFTIGFILW